MKMFLYQFWVISFHSFVVFAGRIRFGIIIISSVCVKHEQHTQYVPNGQTSIDLELGAPINNVAFNK